RRVLLDREGTPQRRSRLSQDQVQSPASLRVPRCLKMVSQSLLSVFLLGVVQRVAAVVPGVQGLGQDDDGGRPGGRHCERGRKILKELQSAPREFLLD